MRPLTAFLVLAGPLLLHDAALAQARSIGDCEKVKGDLAYNQCLASFGPKRGERAPPRGAQPTPEQLQTAAPEPEPAQAGRRGRRGRAVARSAAGRQIAAFDIISEPRSYSRGRYGRQRVSRPRFTRSYGGRRSSYRRRR